MWKDEFEVREFTFEGRAAKLVFPHAGTANGKWLLKTEYFYAFQDMELDLVKRGFHLAYLENTHRWGGTADLDAKLRFRDYLVSEYGLSPRCVPVGMSCGGLIAVKLAARHPEMVSCLYLDAPVINLLSCPMGFGSGRLNSAIDEMLTALGLSRTDILVYRDHPLDNLPRLIAAKIPAVLVCGDSDDTVPYDENGIYVKQAYEQAQLPFLFELKPGCNHHPHGPTDMQIVVEFIESHA